MFNVGPGELLLIMALALIFFGPKKLPEIGKSIGNAMREFRRASSEFMDAVHNTGYDDDHRAPVKNVEYPTTPALASSENYETLPYGADFYPAETPEPTGAAYAADALPAGTVPDSAPEPVAAATAAHADLTTPGDAGTEGAAVTSPERKA